MPYVRRKSRRAPRRKARRKTRKRVSYIPRGVASSSVALRGGVIPKTLKKKFNYVERISLDPATGGLLGTYVFSANDLYDPNRTGTGHQPLTFDQYVPSLYEHATVIGSKITIKAMSTSTTTSSANTVLAVYKRAGATASTTNVETMIEQGLGSYAFIGVSQGANSSTMLTDTFSTRKFLGVSHPLSEDTLRCTSTGSPAEEAFFHIGAASMSTDDPDPLDLLVTIEYTAVLTEPSFIDGS